jgi:acetoacetate decarboxylase
MKIDDVRRAYAMPLTSPSFPPDRTAFSTANT